MLLSIHLLGVTALLQIGGVEMGSFGSSREVRAASGSKKQSHVVSELIKLLPRQIQRAQKMMASELGIQR